MRTTKSVVLEIGTSPLKREVVKKIAGNYLFEYGLTWKLKKSMFSEEWEIELETCCEGTDFSGVEIRIANELVRLTNLYWDFKALGIIPEVKKK